MNAMNAAMDAVKDGAISINKTALLHGVPPTTLKGRMSGRVVHGTIMGPKRYLDKEEVQALADHLVESVKIGYGKTRQQVKSMVERVAVCREESTWCLTYLRWMVEKVFGEGATVGIASGGPDSSCPLGLYKE